jgi:hypothetical protein
MTNNLKTVIAYRFAYIASETTRCAAHQDDRAGVLGPVTHGAHQGYCDVCEEMRYGSEMVDDEIRDLRAEAEAAGDSAMVAICDRALAGDTAAITECVRVMDEAQASGDEAQ